MATYLQSTRIRRCGLARQSTEINPLLPFWRRQQMSVVQRFVLFEPQRCLLKKLVRFNAPIRGLDGLDMEAGALMGMSLFTTTQ